MRSRVLTSLLLVLLMLLSTSLPAGSAEDEDPTPTWVDCWSGHDGGLTAEASEFCNEHHTTAPENRLYGIRWVFLDVSQEDIPSGWVDTQLTNLNAVFSKWNFHFLTSEQIVIEDAVAESNDYYEEWTLRQILPDLRAQLGLSEDDDQALIELKAELEERHVSQEALDELNLDEEFNTAAAFRLASRARSEDITVVIRPNLEAGGKSGGPNSEFQSTNGGAIELNTNLLETGSLTILPHEMGHYFGLSHTHVLDYDNPEAEFDFNNLWSRMEFGGDALRRAVGDDYSQPFGEQWIPYHANNQELEEFSQLIPESLVWPVWRLTYHGDHQEFDNLGEFIAMGEAGDTIYRKNFGRNYVFGDKGSEWSGNNCIWNETAEQGQCRYHEPMEVYDYSHPTIKDVMFFDNGTTSNLMSYVIPSYNEVSSKSGLTSEQIDKMRFGANTPMRLLLRNHCLGTTLCENTEEQEEQDDDTPNDEGSSQNDGNETIPDSEDNTTSPEPDPLDNSSTNPDSEQEEIPEDPEEESNDDSDSWYTPGFELAGTLALLGSASLFQRRRVEY